MIENKFYYKLTIDEQAKHLVTKAEELSSQTLSKEEAIEAINEENSKLRQKYLQFTIVLFYLFYDKIKF